MDAAKPNLPIVYRDGSATLQFTERANRPQARTYLLNQPMVRCQAKSAAALL